MSRTSLPSGSGRISSVLICMISISSVKTVGDVSIPRTSATAATLAHSASSTRSRFYLQADESLNDSESVYPFAHVHTRAAYSAALRAHPLAHPHAHPGFALLLSPGKWIGAAPRPSPLVDVFAHANAPRPSLIVHAPSRLHVTPSPSNGEGRTAWHPAGRRLRRMGLRPRASGPCPVHRASVGRRSGPPNIRVHLASPSRHAPHATRFRRRARARVVVLLGGGPAASSARRVRWSILLTIRCHLPHFHAVVRQTPHSCPHRPHAPIAAF